MSYGSPFDYPAETDLMEFVKVPLPEYEAMQLAAAEGRKMRNTGFIVGGVAVVGAIAAFAWAGRKKKKKEKAPAQPPMQIPPLPVPPQMPEGFFGIDPNAPAGTVKAPLSPIYIPVADASHYYAAMASTLPDYAQQVGDHFQYNLRLIPEASELYKHAAQLMGYAA